LLPVRSYRAARKDTIHVTPPLRANGGRARGMWLLPTVAVSCCRCLTLPSFFEKAPPLRAEMNRTPAEQVRIDDPPLGQVVLAVSLVRGVVVINDAGR
jgi:hypothetical protein